MLYYWTKKALSYLLFFFESVYNIQVQPQKNNKGARENMKHQYKFLEIQTLNIHSFKRYKLNI